MSSPTMSTVTVSPTPTSSSTTATPGMVNKTGNSPLLFFVALGFGVLFTNLWIIIGVKYCFRYQARRRNPEIAMGPVNRRRREKKLMTVEEVQAQFPVTLYKDWRSVREKEGLSTEGGVALGEEEATHVRDVINAPMSGRALSIRSIRSRHSIEQVTQVERTDTAPANEKQTEEEVITAEEEEEIQRLPDMNELASGDTCAICIDTLDDDDEVRGLTCGHAFHCTCVDVWLTTRRAICPLCKKDYWVRKPPPTASTVEPVVRRGRIADTLALVFPRRNRDLEQA